MPVRVGWSGAGFVICGEAWPVAYACGSDRGLDLHKQLASAKTAHAKTVIQRHIDATDRQIDLLVYELHGLTDDEIASAATVRRYL